MVILHEECNLKLVQYHQRWDHWRGVSKGFEHLDGSTAWLKPPHIPRDTPPSTTDYLELLLPWLFQQFQHLLRNFQISADMDEFRRQNASTSFCNHWDNPLNFKSCYLKVSLNIRGSSGNSVPLKAWQGKKNRQQTSWRGYWWTKWKNNSLTDVVPPGEEDARSDCCIDF